MKFSVLIPSYKPQYLREAVESVVNQTYTDWELIVVDDCSPSDLHAIVAPFLQDQRVHYYRNEKNCGAVNLVDNWNICLGHCTGDYVINIGDDDRLLPCCLEEYRKLIDRHPGLNVYHCRTEIINEQGVVTDLQEPRQEWESALSLVWHRWDFREKQYIGDFCYDTEYLKSVGGYFRIPLAWYSDEITATMAAKEKGIANTNAFCFQYRVNSQTITRSTTNAKLKIEAFITQYQWYTAFLDDMAREALSADDRRYLDTIDTQRRKALLLGAKRLCTTYAKGNPFRMVWCYRQLHHLGIGRSMFFKWYIQSF